MATVRLVDESDPNPVVQRVFRDIKETKRVTVQPANWRSCGAGRVLC